VREDFRDIKNLTLDEFIRRARSGTSMGGRKCGIVDARQWRAFYIESAEEVLRKAGDENRALSGDENRAVDKAINDAGELARLIEEIQERHHKDLAGGLVPISQPTFAR